MNLITCQLSAINLGGGTQPRTSISEAVVSEYADAIRRGVELPPLECFWDGATRYLGDGFHRYHAHVQAGSVEVQVNQRNGTRRDAILFAVGANAAHGLRLTADDKRKAVRMVLEDEEWGQWSDRRIAEATNTSPTFVGKVRESLKPPVHVDTSKAGVHVDTSTQAASLVHVDTSPQQRQGKDGKTYEVKPKAARAGKSEPEPAPEADDGPSAADLLDELQRDNEQLQGTVKAMEADDAKAEVVKWKRIADAAQRGQGEAMERAAKAVERESWTMRQLRRCGKAVGEDNPENIAAKVEAMARTVRGKVAA